MAVDRTTSFPVAGLAVVALFLSTTYLAQPQGYDLLRLAETDAGKRLQLSEPPIEARLWEDPFSALGRSRQRLKELCTPTREPSTATTGRNLVTGSITTAATPQPDSRCQTGQAIDAKKFKDDLGANATLIAAILPGAAFTGGEELRRRTRFALLAGLQAEGYVPDDSERMGLLRVQRCEAPGGCAEEGKSDVKPAPTSVLIVYETLTRPGGTPEKDQRVTVLWIDDTAMGRRWLSTLAILLQDLGPEQTKLRILGPSKSDDLVHALLDVMALQPKDKAAAVDKKLEAVAKLRVINPTSTAPASELGTAANLPTLVSCPDKANTFDRNCLDAAFKALFSPGKEQPFFVRTIATDDLLISRLAAELRGRGLDPCAIGDKRRVILFTEWDSIYARTLGDALKRDLQCNGRDGSIKLVSYPYLRGLDGATVDAPVQPSDTARAGNVPQIEWPEGREQRDYVRRLVQQAQKVNEADGEVYAIGMIGSDVHDKLILAQALREAFADRILFTTDMDARFLHPRMTRFTRNLIVASSLPLLLDEKRQMTIAPFRDSYQTATFLGARYAVSVSDVRPDCGNDSNTDKIECVIERALANPVLFEIGREGMAELPTTGVLDTEMKRRHVFAMAAALALLLLAGFMLLGLPAPAMRAARLWWSRGEIPPDARFDLSGKVVVGLETAGLGFATAVVIELAVPGSMGWFGPIFLAGAAAAGCWLFLYPGTPWAQAAFRPSTAAGMPWYMRWTRVVLQGALYAAAVFFLWQSWATPQTGAHAMREPFALFSGVSSWPAQLLRTLVIVLFAWFLDFAWCRIPDTGRRIGEDYFGGDGTAIAAEPPAARWRRAFRAIGNASIWLWQPRVALPNGALDGAKLWQEYRRRLRNGPRLGRLLFWIAITIVLIQLLIFVMDGATPEVPARGLGDRLLFAVTQPISGLTVIILLILVGDATILTWKFITVLKTGRTIYPRATVRRFAAELGPDLRDRATKRIAARVADRVRTTQGGAARSNSLLDDWIDVRLLGEHTAAIGPLIIFPFILVSLTVVSRSRLFDNWEIGGTVLVLLVCYVMWSIAMAALLNFGAEIARRRAVERMQADLLWMKGTGAEWAALAGRFPDLIDQVRNLRQGAFAPFFEQPLVQAMLVPLGGAGGVQLLDLLLFARAP